MLTLRNFQILQWIIRVVEIGLFGLFSLSSVFIWSIPRSIDIPGRHGHFHRVLSLETVDVDKFGIKDIRRLCTGSMEIRRVRRRCPMMRRTWLSGGAHLACWSGVWNKGMVHFGRLAKAFYSNF